MSSEQSFTGDLRSEAKEFTRDKTSRVKWAYGPSFGTGRRVEDGRPRPARIIPTRKSTAGFNKARTAFQNDIANASGDSSADEDVEHPSTAPAPDADITYSYDAERGPSHGSQVLGVVLDKAIERFEVRQTDKLIHDEYEVLDTDVEAWPTGPKIVSNGLAPEDEEYEFINT